MLEAIELKSKTGKQMDTKALAKGVSISLSNFKKSSSHILANLDDIHQEIIIQIWYKSSSYDENRGKESTWAKAIAENMCLDFLRKKSVTLISDATIRKYEEDTDEENSFTASACSKVIGGVWADWEREHARQQLVEQVDECVSALQNPIDRKIATKELEGYSRKEIAQSLNLTENNVNVRFKRNIKPRLKVRLA